MSYYTPVQLDKLASADFAVTEDLLRASNLVLAAKLSLAAGECLPRDLADAELLFADILQDAIAIYKGI